MQNIIQKVNEEYGVNLKYNSKDIANFRTRVLNFRINKKLKSYEFFMSHNK